MDRFAGSLHDPLGYLMRLPILDLIIARDPAGNTTAALHADLPNREATLAPPTPRTRDPKTPQCQHRRLGLGHLRHVG